MALRTFVSLKENIQEDVTNRMIRIASHIDSSDNNLDRNYSQSKAKFKQIRQALRSRSYSYNTIPQIEIQQNRNIGSQNDIKLFPSSSSSGEKCFVKHSNGTVTSPEDEPIEEVKEDNTVQSLMESQENEQRNQMLDDEKSLNDVPQLSSAGSVNDLIDSNL